MIRVAKRANPPARLAAGAPLVAGLYARSVADPATAGRPPDTFGFDEKIYAHATVKDALKEDQNNKCAYCEAYFAGNSPGDVEHLRAKSWTQQRVGAPKEYPGYYWLAYDWRNLLYSCEICNRSRKRNVFPIGAGGVRARTPADDLAAENPLLIDPAGLEDPRDHIRFRNNKPYALTEQGRITIEVLGLDRPTLDPPRLTHLSLLRHLRTLAALDPTDPNLTEAAKIEIENAKVELEGLRAPTSVFSAMANDFLSA